MIKTSCMVFAAITSAVLIAFSVAPGISSAEAIDFPDVDPAYEAASAVKDLVDADIVEGYDDGTFRPGNMVTRAEAVKMIAKILGLDTNAPNTNFPDVEMDVWYTTYINELYAINLIEGYEDGTFAPGRNMTRAEFAKLIIVAYDLEIVSSEHPFTDFKDNVWYAAYVETLYANGLIKGQTDTTFGPNEDIKRIDFALLLANTVYKFGNVLPRQDVSAELEVAEDTLLQEALIAAEDAIAILPTNKGITIDDVKTVKAARELVNVIVELGGEEAGVRKLFLAHLESAEEAIRLGKEKVGIAEIAIKSLPNIQAVTLDDAEEIADVRKKVDAAFAFNEKAEIMGLEILIAAEKEVIKLTEAAAEELAVAITIAQEAIDSLPASKDVSFIDIDAVVDARAKVDLALGLDNEVEFNGMGSFVAAEAKVAELLKVLDSIQIEELEDIVVDASIDIEDLNLPEQLEVTFADESKENPTIKWDLTQLDLNTSGKYTLIGTIETYNVTTSIHVIVQQAYPDNVTISRSHVTLKEGTSRKLKVKVTPEFVKNKNLTWESSDNAIATVNRYGKVTAHSEGTAKVTVRTDNEHADNTMIHVSNKPALNKKFRYHHRSR